MTRWLLLAMLACNGGPPSVEPNQVQPAITALNQALDDLVEADAGGDPFTAKKHWRNAHGVWDETLGPALEPRLGPKATLELELHLARIRHDLKVQPGAAEKHVNALRTALESPLKSMPQAPPAPQDPQ